MDELLAANRRHWDELVGINARSGFYDLEGLKRGRLTLPEFALQELGQVEGKALLHLQCHFGMDTISLARLGATATGVDFSDEAIVFARSLSQELNVPAQFVCSDIHKLSDVLNGKFDVVFTSMGVLCWLPDLARWAEVIAHFLGPGGVFYILETHPFLHIFSYDRNAAELTVSQPYFGSGQPLSCEEQGTYADWDAQLANPLTHEWQHTLSDVVSALVAVGLRIEFLHEFPFCSWQRFPFMVKSAAHRWTLPGDMSLPLTFSLKATKE